MHGLSYHNDHGGCLCIEIFRYLPQCIDISFDSNIISTVNFNIYRSDKLLLALYNWVSIALSGLGCTNDEVPFKYFKGCVFWLKEGVVTI